MSVRNAGRAVRRKIMRRNAAGGIWTRCSFRPFSSPESLAVSAMNVASKRLLFRGLKSTVASHCGQTVAEFCRAECVSQPSFYQWKKKLGCPRTNIRTAPPGKSNSSIESFPSMAAFQTVEMTEPAMHVRPSRPDMTVRFGQGIEVEIGSDLRVVETVMRQLLDASMTAAGDSSC